MTLPITFSLYEIGYVKIKKLKVLCGSRMKVAKTLNQIKNKNRSWVVEVDHLKLFNVLYFFTNGKRYTTKRFHL